MGNAIFEALKADISRFLGGAAVELHPAGQAAADGGIRVAVTIDDHPYVFTARREGVPFTRSEEAFCREFLTAFVMLSGGFHQQGYAAQFRTALLSSLMDITVARSLRLDNRKVFWPIQQLIQLMKGLSYQRYEGEQATSGFIVHRTTQAELGRLFRQRRHTMSALKPAVGITPSFFENPLTYRFIDGSNLFFVANIQLQVGGVLRLSSDALNNKVERQTQRELFSLVQRCGSGAFAMTVNRASEIEVLTSPARILVRRHGGWCIFDPDILRGFLADVLEPDPADDLVWTVYALSKIRHGTVILIHPKGGRGLATLRTGSVGGDDPVSRLLTERVKGRSIAELKQAGTLVRILSADGLTVFSRAGRLVETGFIIDTSHAREMVTGGGRTTAAIAASRFGKVIKVSQDGPIELYHDGKMVYRFG